MSGASGDTGGREYLIEFIEMGDSVRVAAIDADTGEEVVIQAPKHAPRSQMEQVVIAKLDRKLGRQKPTKSRQKTKRPGNMPGRGIIV